MSRVPFQISTFLPQRTRQHNYVVETLRLLSDLPVEDLRRRLFQTEVAILFRPDSLTNQNSLCLNDEFEHCSEQDMPSEDELLQLALYNGERKQSLQQDRLDIPFPGLTLFEQRHPQPLEYTLNLYPVSFLNYVTCHLKYTNCNNTGSLIGAAAENQEETIDYLPLIKPIGSPSAYGVVYTTELPLDIDIDRNELNGGGGNNNNPSTYINQRNNSLGYIRSNNSIVNNNNNRYLRGQVVRTYPSTPQGFIVRPQKDLIHLHFGLGDAVVLKTFKGGDPVRQAVNSTHELLAGFRIDELRMSCPNYIYTYGFLQCSDIAACQQLNPNAETTYPVLAIEFVAQAKSLRSMYATFNQYEYVSILSQLFAAEGQGWEEIRLIHQDMHDENVLIQVPESIQTLQQNLPSSSSSLPQFIQYTNERWFVQLRRYLPRIIDYGLASFQNPVTGAQINFVETLAPVLGRFNFISDIYKLLSFGIWTTSYSNREQRNQFRTVRRINLEILRNLYVHLSRTLQMDTVMSRQEQIGIQFYITLMLANAVYRLFYQQIPAGRGGDAPEPLPTFFREQGFEQILRPLSQADGDTKLFPHYLYVMAIFEYTQREIERESYQDPDRANAAPMFPRNFNALTLVDYLYPPTLEGMQLMETTYLRARGDRTAQQAFPVIGEYLRVVQDTDIFARIRRAIGVSNFRDYDVYVQRCAEFLRQALPNMDVFIEHVLLQPSSPLANQEIKTLFNNTIFTKNALHNQFGLDNVDIVNADL